MRRERGGGLVYAPRAPPPPPPVAVTECGKPLADWQAQGEDLGTTAAPYPPASFLIDQAKLVLGL